MGSYVHPLVMHIVMMQTPGYHEIKEFIGALNAMYTFEKCLHSVS